MNNKCEECIRGWWSDGYDFVPIYEDGGGFNINEKNEDLKWFNYCPECGYKFEQRIKESDE